MLLITMAIGILFLSLFLFTTLQSYFSLESDFIERISQRLIDEPVAVFNKHLGMNYNANSLEAMDWREEASADAFNAFMNLSTLEQLFGIGYWGFIVRDLGHTGLNPHNGFLLLAYRDRFSWFVTLHHTCYKHYQKIVEGKYEYSAIGHDADLCDLLLYRSEWRIDFQHHFPVYRHPDS